MSFPKSAPVAMRQSGAEGFALSEAIVALTILGVVLALAYSTFVTGWRAGPRITGESRAVAIARAQLAAAGVETPLSEGSSSGTTNGYDWRVNIMRYEPRSKSPARSRLTAWSISVEVTFSEALASAPRTIRLATVKLGTDSK